MEADEAGTLAAMKAHRRELWTPEIDAYGGRMVGAAGDSILVEFQSAVAAVEFSVTVQQGMVARNADLPSHRQMLLRVGINIGEVVIDGEDIFGDSVNIDGSVSSFTRESDRVQRSVRPGLANS